MTRRSLWLGIFAVAPFAVLAVILIFMLVRTPDDVPQMGTLPRPRPNLYVSSGASEQPAAVITVSAPAPGPMSAAPSHILAYDALVEPAANRHGVPANLVRAVIQTESNGNIRARSSVGAQGLMQLMPGTAKDLNVQNAYDPRQNIEGGVKYLRQLSDQFDGDLVKTVAAYNAGPAAVKRYGGAVPPFQETQGYVRKVMGLYSRYGAEPSGPTAAREDLQPIEDDTSLLMWPAPGTVVRKFSARANTKQTGIEVRVAPGASVRAASDGRVVAVLNERGGTRSVTIAHDERYTTTYSRLAVVFVTIGDDVISGDVIGSVAVEKGKATSLLLFDLRDGETPKDPLDFRWRGVTGADRSL